MWVLSGGAVISGPSVAYYVPAHEVSEDAVNVHAAVEVASGSVADVDLVELPAIESAATIVHQGSMDDASRSMQVLAELIKLHGHDTGCE
ncbi:hypothetical protein AB0H57_13175 [Micromonospora sp. NPDC050686]|uniref:hypothetical protein n=1 Tax=Micromonospora sp. NPDC050686 TaxID=3154631 RepID=UPI0033C6284E